MPPDRFGPRIVSVAGGKGGVGKSTIAANLALAVGRLGLRCVIVDADLGAANLHTMFGALRPPATIADFLDDRIDGLEPAMLRVAPTVELVSGTSRPGSANLPSSHKLRLLAAIHSLEADCVVVDVGAGTSYAVVDIVAASDIKLCVITPQLPSLHNAYALFKACVHRVVRKLCDDDTQRAFTDAALARENKARTVVQLLEVLRPIDAGLADRIARALAIFGGGVVGNQVTGDAEVRALARFSTLLYDQLGLQAPVMAAIGREPALAGALRVGQGTIAARGDPSYAMFARLARAVVEADVVRLRGAQDAAKHGTMPLWIQRADGTEVSR